MWRRLNVFGVKIEIPNITKKYPISACTKKNRTDNVEHAYTHTQILSNKNNP